MSLYTNEFYDLITEGSIRSARKIVPEVLNIFKDTASVVDIGCGTGAWLSVFMENGVSNILGIDGDYIDKSRLLIPQDRFVAHDLSTAWQPKERFDLVVSLEVAEHVPESSANDFVQTLINCSDNILFSAAVPGQNGVGHVNEQWPSYWVPKFQEHDYLCSSNFRFQFWHDEDIENWYRQNILLFTRQDIYQFRRSWEEFRDLFDYPHPQILDVIHYNNWNGKI